MTAARHGIARCRLGGQGAFGGAGIARAGFARACVDPAADPDAPGQQAVLTAGVEVGQQDSDRLADEPAPVDDHPEPAHRQARVLQVKELGGGKVHRDLVVVLFPARCRAFTSPRWLGYRGAQELLNPRDTYPA